MMPFIVSSRRHPAFGQQVILQFSGDFVLNLTQAEASSLSFALISIRDGISLEREIYMSPIASDAAFAASVHDRGIGVLIASGTLDLDWAMVGRLACAMADAIG